MSELAFPVKTVQWSAYEQNSPIILQEENGPCPLIALVNTLILQSDITSRTVAMENTVTDEDAGGSSQQQNTSSQENGVREIRTLLNKYVGKEVPISELLSVLGDMLMNKSTVAPEIVNNLLESLPLLHTGLDVNPNLITGSFPPDDLASQIFAAFGLTFVHGWCWEPEPGSPADEIFSEYQTFESVQQHLFNQPRESAQRREVEEWLESNGTQLTNYGLQMLDQQVEADSVATFFRNNHFSTIYKAQNHDFYLLLTDNVFARRSKYVWQSLNSISGGEDLFFAGDFSPIAEEGEISGAGDENYYLAQQLQEKEDSEYAQMLQDNYNRRKQKTRSKNGKRTDSGTGSSASKNEKPKKEKKKGACCIQ